mgnify:CR=1 FL=1
MQQNKVLDQIDIFKFWEMYDFSYLHPEVLNEKESAYIEVKNPAHAGDWSLPRTVSGWIFIEAWFDNMVAGQKGRYGATRLQYRPDMGQPIFLSGHDNSNNGASMWFIPHVAIGGDSPWQIQAEIKHNKRGQPEVAWLFAKRKL